MDATNDAATQALNQYLTFDLDDEIFALDINSVREVLELSPITKVPRTPEHMRGVINVRGKAVPVVDMRLKFGLEQGEVTVNTCIIIIEVDHGSDSVTLGALVDSVREVIEMQEDQIDPPPRFGAAIDTAFIKGMGKYNENFVIILDGGRIFSEQELAVAAVPSETPATPEAEPLMQM
jgi:purine-binding chemotaxis protein CheW